jgi:hypothetical protein
MKRLLVVAVLAAAVAVLLLASRCSTRPDNGAVPQPAASSPAASTSPPSAVVDNDDEHSDDGAVDTVDSPAVITAGPAAANEAAIQTVVKLLNTQGKTPPAWRASLRPYVSDDLYAQLADADPTTVPLGRVDDGKVTSATAGDGLVQVQVPVVDTTSKIVATIRVTLSSGTGRWLATELDVERA